MPRKSSGASKQRNTLPDDVAAMVAGLDQFLLVVDPVTGRKPADAKYGVYAFFDYDGEPIYCGQTAEQLRTRIRRHLTNQRTDAVAMRVLDPLEVAEIEVWPFFDLESPPAGVASPTAAEVKATLNAAEYTLFEKLIAESELHRILNEKRPLEDEMIDLPASFRSVIVPEELRQRLGHPDVRIARRAQKIAELAGIIAQRDVSPGLRNTLVTQAERLLKLANERYVSVVAADPERAARGLFGHEGDG